MNHPSVPRTAPSGRGAAAPGSYAAWVAWIEAFRRGEDRATGTLTPIDGRWGSYVEARLVEKLSAAFCERVRAWQTGLGERIVALPPIDAASAEVLLREAAPGLEPLARVAGSPLVPRAMAASMHELLGQVRAGARDAVRECRSRAEADVVPGLRAAAVPEPRRGSSPVPTTRRMVLRP